MCSAKKENTQQGITTVLFYLSTSSMRRMLGGLRPCSHDTGFIITTDV